MMNPLPKTSTSDSIRPLPPRARGAFTLIELLVVIAIIAILAAILVPAVKSALDKGKMVHCTSNLRSIGQSFHSFASDHEGHLPASADSNTGPEDWQASWLGLEIIPQGFRPNQFNGWPGRRLGTVAHYYLNIPLNHSGGGAASLLRCPNLPATPIFSAQGSNGLFDYAMWKCMGGAIVESLPATAYAFFRTPDMIEVPMPLLVEEDPLFGLNNRNVDPGHSNTDRIGSWHSDGVGQYATAAGGVSQIRHSQAKYNANTWYAETPSGALKTLGTPSLPFGGWSRYGASTGR